MMGAALLEVDRIGVRFPVRGPTGFRHRPTLPALDDVSLRCEAGARVGIVGESGSGKSTLARVVLGLVRAQTGRVAWRGDTVDYRDAAALRALRREAQIVFQDPFGSLDPRMTAGAIVAEALHALAPAPVARDDATRRVAEAFREVGLPAEFTGRYPHELSGGQCQRVAIARATIVRPRLLVCDEAVSALDVSVQAQIVNLLRDLSERHGMALLFISHNLAVVRHLCDEVVVLRQGRIVEQGPRAQVFERPQQQYTRDLLAAVPVPEPRVQRERVEKGTRD